MRKKLPLMPIIALLMEILALLFITLVLVSPIPFEHNSISLLVVSPQPSQASVISSQSAPEQTLPQQPINTTLSTESSPLTANLSSTDHKETVESATSQAGASSPSVITPAPAATVIPSANLLPGRRSYDQYGGSLNRREELNETITGVSRASVSNGSAAVSEASSQSKLLMRLGPLGNCFRVPSGKVETCSSPKLTPEYDYSTFLQSLVLYVVSGDNSSTVNVPLSNNVNATQALSDLPKTMTTYPTVLLLVIICQIFVVIVWTAQMFQMLQRIRSQNESSPQILLTPLWAKIALVSRWTILVATAILVVMSGIEKFNLSQAKNSFNSAMIKMNTTQITSSDQSQSSVILQADTSNGFGFVWCSSMMLLLALWLRRLWVRRQLQQAHVLAAHPKDEELQEVSLPPILLKTPVPSASSSETLRNQASLPSIRTAFHHIPKEGAKDSPPPFSTYDGHSDSRKQGVSSAISANSGCPEREEILLPEDFVSTRYASRKCTGDGCSDVGMGCPQTHTCTNLQRSYHPSSRTPSPAPNYWATEWGQQEKERERQYMAELRRHRSEAKTVANSI